jgi:hypothetical protein
MPRSYNRAVVNIQGIIHYSVKEPLINLIKRADARRGQAKKRSLHGVNEYFEPGSNAADAASAN